MKQPSGPPHILTLVSATLLNALSTVLIMPSLPSIAAHYQSTATIAQFTVSAFLATSAVLQLFIGPLSDRYGRRPIMLWSFVIFILGSLLCIYAPTIELFIAGRVIQSVSIAGLVLARAIVRDLYSADEAASRIGYITMGLALGPIVAPAFGGLLDEHFGWQANLYAMLIYGLLALLVIFLNLGETNKQEFTSLRTQLSHYPELFRSRRFWGLSATAAFNSGVFYAFLGGGSFVAVNVLHLSPSLFGLMFGLIGLGYILGNFLSGRFATRFGTNLMSITGCSITTLGAFLPVIFLGLGYTHPLHVFAPMFLVSLGNGIALPSLNAAMVSVRPRLAGTASGLGGSIQVGGAAMLSVLAGWAVTEFTANYTLFAVMTCVSLSGILTALYVIGRTRQVEAESVSSQHQQG
jgi:DHA1 family bicyclomycin/chloramphenicol resistance-like MFS transporter